MPRVQNPGLSSVTTDGVTIQGNGTAASPVAIKAVQVDGVTITGAGTVASPLVGSSGTPTGWPVTYFVQPGSGSISTTTLAAVINTLKLFGAVIGVQVQLNKIIVEIGTADATNLYDIGLYTYAGALAAHIGAQHIPSTGVQSFAVVGGPITLNPGRYFFATTGNSSTATLSDYSAPTGQISYQHQTAFGSSTGGALPNSITPPADSSVDTNIPLFSLST